MESTLKIIRYAMEMEKQGEEFYKQYKNKIENERAKKVFSNLAEVENEHYNILKKYHDMLSNNRSWDELNIDLSNGEEIFESFMTNEYDKITSKDKDVEHSLSDMAIMRMAYLLENDFANFYEKALEDAKNDEEKRLLKTLARWENKHRELFYKEFKDAMETNWFNQNFYPF